LLCGAILMVAGCVSEQKPYAISADQMYNYDLGPQPFPDLTPYELRKIAESPHTLSSNPAYQTRLDLDYSDR
jgi:hypothetical protein